MTAKFSPTSHATEATGASIDGRSVPGLSPGEVYTRLLGDGHTAQSYVVLPARTDPDGFPAGQQIFRISDVGTVS